MKYENKDIKFNKKYPLMKYENKDIKFINNI